MRDTDMAREAGILATFNTLHPSIEIFAERVRADEREAWEGQTAVEVHEAVLDEREACAKVAAGYGPSRRIVSKNPSSQIVGRWEGEQAASFGIEAAIRARGNT